jgi:hypothetical protein
LGERLLCKQEVIGSIPFTSTISLEMVDQEIPITSSKALKRHFLAAPNLLSYRPRSVQNSIIQLLLFDCALCHCEDV